MDDAFFAEIEEAAQAFAEGVLLYCTGQHSRDILLSQVNDPVFLEKVCACNVGSSRWPPHSEYYLNSQQQWVHIPCGKLSRYSIYQYCLDCKHVYFDSAEEGKLNNKRVVKNVLCPCCRN